MLRVTPSCTLHLNLHSTRPSLPGHSLQSSSHSPGHRFLISFGSASHRAPLRKLWKKAALSSCTKLSSKLRTALQSSSPGSSAYSRSQKEPPGIEQLQSLSKHLTSTEAIAGCVLDTLVPMPAESASRRAQQRNAGESAQGKEKEYFEKFPTKSCGQAELPRASCGCWVLKWLFSPPSEGVWVSVDNEHLLILIN